jgi:hypothetical protein
MLYQSGKNLATLENNQKSKGGRPYNKKTIVLFERHCHATECKVMPVIPVNKVVDPKRIIVKNGGPRRRRGTGVADPQKRSPP